ncbi:agmatine deiminase family protein [Zooshikella ganghwensis]|uniref:agmatine deiminase family protein n=1 Tax=Zooshikella ganghwensis TaxID=202772 RepID=UPI001F15B1DE|nr:agmatine deiminase family protein [Zooshikella ganghwensis]
MLTRRRFIYNTSILVTGFCMQNLVAGEQPESSMDWFAPEEGQPHERTWMAFGAEESIWGAELLPVVQQNLATIARTIAHYEPVSMLVRESEYDLARQMVGDKVELVVADLNDLWMRDTGPVFVMTQQGQKAAVDFNFNGWGNKQQHNHDAKVAKLVASKAGVKLLNTRLVLEGGGIEVDGQGTAIITESCTLNKNRNPGISKAQFEDWLMPLLGLNKIIWLPGIKGKDITDGHTDFYARFAKPGVVLAGYDPDPHSFDHDVTKRHLELLRAAKDAQGKPLKVLTLEGPMTIREEYASEDFAAGYIGFYLCNGAVIMQGFGDKAADQAAKKTLQEVFPKRTIEQIKIDGIAAGGGSIHCTTQQEPYV